MSHMAQWPQDPSSLYHYEKKRNLIKKGLRQSGSRKQVLWYILSNNLFNEKWKHEVWPLTTTSQRGDGKVLSLNDDSPEMRMWPGNPSETRQSWAKEERGLQETNLRFLETKRPLKQVLETTLIKTARIYKLSLQKILSTAGITTSSKAYFKNICLWIDGNVSLQNHILFQISALDTQLSTVSKLNSYPSGLTELSFRRHPYLQWWRWQFKDHIAVDNGHWKYFISLKKHK